ncbi:hypothetical protein IV417_14235 [Alphaproteobacteria bacterium KMM 3653]|uniref:Tetratricopeptide repeat protein n=1 Tax=Harenicola maris TaxID=2841044 RepID=A0AAP2G9K7_9RHOB|nr:hypothetical protein [Harenicola maris]
MTRILPLTTALALSFAAPAFAAGSGTSLPPKPTETTTKCEEGQVYDEKTKSCLDSKSDLLNDDDRYEAARELAYGGKYTEALIVLAAADNPSDPRILNYKGFTNRKLGNMRVAMAYYQEALAIDPDYNLARSYMGQGLLASGDFAAAGEQLHEIAARGGKDTWAYEALAMAIQGQPSDY